MIHLIVILIKEVDFVILLVGLGQNKSDALYESNYKKCKQYGLPVGAYWYDKATATTVEVAKREANYFLEKLEGMQLNILYNMIFKNNQYLTNEKKMSQICYKQFFLLEKRNIIVMFI